MKIKRMMVLLLSGVMLASCTGCMGLPTYAPDTAETEAIEEINDKLPKGAVYIQGGKKITRKVPITRQSGDEFIFGNYIYKYNHFWDIDTQEWKEDREQDGWGVITRSRYGEEYGPIVSEINEGPTTNMDCTFLSCEKMKKAPAIPKTVNSMKLTYAGCKGMEEATEIPEGVLDMTMAFAGCEAMVKAPDLDKVHHLDGVYAAFVRCKSMKETPLLPNHLKVMTSMFEECTKLEKVVNLPEGLATMNNTFTKCSSLKEVPKLPKHLGEMSYAFEGCTSLETAPDMSEARLLNIVMMAFKDCKALKGEIVINASPQMYSDFFKGAGNAPGAIRLTGTSGLLRQYAGTNEKGYVVV